jgi:ABC-type uncharacterized transport system substrate-binding protein
MAHASAYKRLDQSWTSTVFLTVRLMVKICLLALFAIVSSMAVHAANIVVVDTVEHEASHRLARAFQANCDACSTIEFMHMEGSRRAGQAIAVELKKRENNKTVDLVVAIGPPAAEILSGTLRKTPIIYTMVGTELLHLGNRSNLHALPVDAPLEIQLQALTTTLPSIRSVGLILSEPKKWKPHPFDRTNLPAGLRLYEISGAKKMPEALRKASNENDALIFMRDPSVVNRDSIKFIVEYTLQKRIRTFTYSKTLVDMGMGMALVPNPTAFGERAAALTKQLLNGDATVHAPLSLDDFHLHQNARALAQIAGARKNSSSENEAK